MLAPLMPKSTAVWLIENTGLTFEQIADFCRLHVLEIQALADEEGSRIIGQSPLLMRILTADDIARCEADPSARLKGVERDLPEPQKRAKGPRYTPIAKRGDKPDAIAWLIKHHPELNDSVIGKLVGTTRNTIQSVRDKTHPNASNLQPRSPVEVGLCSFEEMDKAINKARKQLEKEGKWKPKPEEEAVEAPSARDSGFDFTNFLRGSGT